MWSTSRGSGAPQFIGNIFTHAWDRKPGKAYLRKLKAQNIAKSTASARQILDLVIAGEYPHGDPDFQSPRLYQQSRGAPVDWQPLGAGDRDQQFHRRGQKCAPPQCRDAFSRFCAFQERADEFFKRPIICPRIPKIAALQADLKPGIRFKKVNYLSPDVLYDKGNEWSDYFDKEFSPMRPGYKKSFDAA